jgi:DNA-binding NarL/FixJ family response regulator
MAFLDIRFRVLDATPEFHRQFGIRPGGARGRDFFEFLHPSVREATRTEFTRLTVDGRDRFSREVMSLGPPGDVFAGELTGIAVQNPARQVTALLARIDPATPAPAVRMPGGGTVLTELDARIIEGIATGESNVQLAGRLHLSRQGIEYRVAAMLRRFRAPNRAALVSRAYAMGLLGVALPRGRLPLGRRGGRGVRSGVVVRAEVAGVRTAPGEISPSPLRRRSRRRSSAGGPRRAARRESWR